MSECFPPIPLYIVTGIITAMFITVASKIEGEGERSPEGDIKFAWFLLLVLAVPFVQLLLVLLTNVIYGQWAASPDRQMSSDTRWLLGFHIATLFPLLIGVSLVLALSSCRICRATTATPPHRLSAAV